MLVKRNEYKELINYLEQCSDRGHQKWWTIVVAWCSKQELENGWWLSKEKYTCLRWNNVKLHLKRKTRQKCVKIVCVFHFCFHFYKT